MAPAYRRNNTEGFTLIEILLALTIVGIVVVFAIGLSGSITNMGKVQETRSRMGYVAKKVQEFYRAHHADYVDSATPTPAEDFPAIYTGSPAVLVNEVPVGATELNIEQKYRLDAWGQYIHYNFSRNAGTIGTDHNPFVAGLQYLYHRTTNNPNGGYQTGTKTLISALTVDGKAGLAGVLISAGPNQVFDTTLGGPTYTTAGDDIIIPIDVSQEATEIALEDLKILNDKAKAFDGIYQGINNDSTGGVDDGGCVAETTNTVSVAVQFSPGADSSNDPNCGTVTLDNIKATNYNRITSGYGCDIWPQWCWIYTSFAGAGIVIDERRNDTARAFISVFFNLPDSRMIDPWLNGYIWGCGDDTICQNLDGNDVDLDPSDSRYHKFYSAGPDGTILNTDDIVP